MKTILLAILILTALTSFSQNTAEVSKKVAAQTPEEVRDSLFTNIKLANVPTGFLMEYGMWFADPTKSNGGDNTDTLAINHWRMLYAGLQSSAVNKNAKSFIPLKELNATLKTSLADNKVLIPMLHAEYNSFKEAVLDTTGIPFIKGRYKKDSYRTLELFAAAPAAKKIDSRLCTFFFSTDMVFSEKTISAENLSVDFNDGKGKVPVIFDKPVIVQYPTNGIKYIEVIYDENGENKLRSISKIEIEEEEKQERVSLKSVTNYPNPIPTTITGRAYNGASATLDVEVIYGWNNSILDKPFILVEGFDPMDLDPTTGSWDNGDSWDWLNENSGLLGYDLLAQGYDIILVNFESSTTYIQRNAYALQELIELVNSHKACTQSYQNVIMGLSMGGLVARYALAEMEQRNEDHDTRLYISYDSPHQGANVPYGFVHFIDDAYHFDLMGYSMRDLVPEVEQGYDIMSSPAARQMLILGGGLYNYFYSELSYLGMPQMSRNIALANGSMQGQRLADYAPEDQIMDLHYEKKLVGSLWRFRLDVNCYALADNPSSSKLFYEWHHKFIAWSGKSASIATLAYDNAPSGLYSFPDMGFEIDTTALPPGSSLTLVPDRFSFVPTASAFNIPITATSIDASIINAEQTPFVSIFTGNPVANENHIQMTPAKANWILSQIAIDDYISCNYECVEMNGPDFVCSGGATFDFNISIGSASVSWTYSSNLSGPSSGTSITVSPKYSTNNETGWVKATITGNCGTKTFQKTVYAGKPFLDVSSQYFKVTSADGGDWYVCTDQVGNEFDLSYFNDKCGCTNYEIKLTDPNETTVYDQFYSSNGVGDLDYSHLPDGWYIFWARGLNACGWGNWFGMELEFRDCSQMLLLLSPNPTSGETTLSIEPTSKQAAFDETAQWNLEVYNASQLLKEKLTGLRGQSTKIQTAGWKEGVYLVRVMYKGELLTGKLVVKR